MTGVEHLRGRRAPTHLRRRGGRRRRPAPPRDRAAARPAADAPEQAWRRRSPGPGAVLAMLGVDGELPQLAHHSLFFTSDWDHNFGDIFGSETRVPDPASLYVCKPSETDATVAPDGAREPLRARAGAGRPVDRARRRRRRRAPRRWSGRRTRPSTRSPLGRRSRTWPSGSGAPHGRSRATSPRRSTPGSGSALGLAHSLRQSAFLRPANVSSKVDGLHYAGASTRPGCGTPDVPDQRRAGPQAADRRPVGAAGARMTRAPGPPAGAR